MCRLNVLASRNKPGCWARNRTIVSPSATTSGAGIGTAPKTTILAVLGLGFVRRLFSRHAVDPLAGLQSERLRLIVGLGNPGPEYAETRHNVGFRVVDQIASRLGAQWHEVSDVQSFVAVTDALVLGKPQTFMNRSGAAVRHLVERLELKREHCLVVYDDMDLPFGALRLRQRGSAGTHNGMRSVVAALQSEDVPRLRVGISQASQPGGAIDHVLSEFTPDEQPLIDELVTRAAEAVLAWANEGAAMAMNRYNKS